MLVVLLCGVAVFIALRYKQLIFAGLLFGISSILQLFLYGIDSGIDVVQLFFGAGLPILSGILLIMGIIKGIKNYHDNKSIARIEIISGVIILIPVIFFLMFFIGMVIDGW